MSLAGRKAARPGAHPRRRRRPPFANASGAAHPGPGRFSPKSIHGPDRPAAANFSDARRREAGRSCCRRAGSPAPVAGRFAADGSRCCGVAHILHQQHEVGSFQRLARAPHAFGLDVVAGSRECPPCRPRAPECRRDRSVRASTSRVVPGMSVTMALSWPDRAFNRLDLPALGGPTMASTMPSRSNRPWRASRSSVREPVPGCRRTRSTTSLSARKSISSSGKSMAASTNTRRAVSSSCSALHLLRENTPAGCAAPRARRPSVPDSIRSAMASACTRSSLSFRKARSENSPGSRRPCAQLERPLHQRAAG